MRWLTLSMFKVMGFYTLSPQCKFMQYSFLMFLILLYLDQVEVELSLLRIINQSDLSLLRLLSRLQ